MACCGSCSSSTAKSSARRRPTIGYLHTGIEKTCEQKKWQQVIPLVERMDYLSAQSNSMCFCLSVERCSAWSCPSACGRFAC